MDLARDTALVRLGKGAKDRMVPIGERACRRLTRLAQYDAANAPISDTSYARDRAGNILTQADSDQVSGEV